MKLRTRAERTGWDAEEARTRKHTPYAHARTLQRVHTPKVHAHTHRHGHTHISTSACQLVLWFELVCVCIMGMNE